MRTRPIVRRTGKACVRPERSRGALAPSRHERPSTAARDERAKDLARATGRDREAGFTLVELMVVIVIIGLLATIVVLNVMPATDRAAATKARADIATLETAVDMYKLDHQRYPTSQEGLQALVASNYVRRLPDDPWGNPYRYSAPGADGRPFAIVSLGADGREGGSGENEDISN